MTPLSLMQISKALLTEDQKLRLPRFLEDEVKDPERTKQVVSKGLKPS